MLFVAIHFFIIDNQTKLLYPSQAISQSSSTFVDNRRKLQEDSSKFCVAQHTPHRSAIPRRQLASPV
jgi:hypothetical protein